MQQFIPLRTEKEGKLGVHIYTPAPGAYISDCRQVVIALSVVVVKLASLALGGPRR